MSCIVSFLKQSSGRRIWNTSKIIRSVLRQPWMVDLLSSSTDQSSDSVFSAIFLTNPASRRRSGSHLVVRVKLFFLTPKCDYLTFPSQSHNARAAWFPPAHTVLPQNMPFYSTLDILSLVNPCQYSWYVTISLHLVSLYITKKTAEDFNVLARHLLLLIIRIFIRLFHNSFRKSSCDAPIH